MNEEKENIEFLEEQEEKSIKNHHLMKGLIDGTLLTRQFVVKQIPFFLFLSFLCLIYISNRYHADSVRNKVSVLKNELRELRSRALYTTSELMKMSRQTEVAREVKEKGLELKESLEPPKKIIIE